MGRIAARTGRVAAATVLLTSALLAASSGPSPAGAAAAPSAPLAGAAAVGGPPVPGVDGWRWPLRPRPALLRPFEAPPAPWAPGHRGVDLAAVPGDVVLSPAAGVVAFAGPVAGRGVVSVQHAGSLRSSVEPVGAGVRVGDVVAAGDALGVLTAATSHCGAVSCLHWGVRRAGDYVDPLGLVSGRGPAVLLPLRSARGTRPSLPVVSAVAAGARPRPR